MADEDFALWLTGLKERARAFGTQRQGEDLATRWAPTLHQEQALNPDLQFRSDNDAWEDVAADAADTAGAPRTGVMVAFYPSTDQALQLAVAGGEDAAELHLTLAFLGEVGAELQPGDEATIVEAVRAWAATQQPITAATNGLGVFQNDEFVTYANIDAPKLPALRQSLVEALDKAGVAPLQTHGYTPHMTLIYADRRDVEVPRVDMRFGDVVVAFAGHQTVIPLGMQHAALQVSDRSEPEPASESAAPTAKAFVADVNGRTLITAPATAAYQDPTLEDIMDQPLLMMHGRFVGAEQPNRNGALWSSGDLQMARATVTHGPLNWLHEGRHIIGSLTDAQYVEAEQAADGFTQPHITATAAIWRWIYPDEAFVVQQASDLGQLWYSMECVSREVACAGPNGCGNTTTYAQYMAGAACSHITQRASTRQFIKPVFLGGAIIVPPTRPGWADADAAVMSTAAKMAEAAYEQAGEPDVSATTWEQIMAQVVKFSAA